MGEESSLRMSGKPCVLRKLPEQKISSNIIIGTHITIHDRICQNGENLVLARIEDCALWHWILEDCVEEPANVVT